MFMSLRLEQGWEAQQERTPKIQLQYVGDHWSFEVERAHKWNGGDDRDSHSFKHKETKLAIGHRPGLNSLSPWSISYGFEYKLRPNGHSIEPSLRAMHSISRVLRLGGGYKHLYQTRRDSEEDRRKAHRVEILLQASLLGTQLTVNPRYDTKSDSDPTDFNNGKRHQWEVEYLIGYQLFERHSIAFLLRQKERSQHTADGVKGKRNDSLEFRYTYRF